MKLSKASSILVELKKYSLHFKASRLVGIKIARGHDASGIDNISVYIGQTIPEAGTVKGLIRWPSCSRYSQKCGNVRVIFPEYFP